MTSEVLAFVMPILTVVIGYALASAHYHIYGYGALESLGIVRKKGCKSCNRKKS